ncbi:hypothetical protein R3P38DRAFT_3029553 [Favolaschia claudopus]|uniref:Secreted protein n=1 Tax=Favolaschia claudopus TaxID=2862362 RepID=A0AAW0AEE1_9AGAR
MLRRRNSTVVYCRWGLMLVIAFVASSSSRFSICSLFLVEPLVEYRPWRLLTIKRVNALTCLNCIAKASNAKTLILHAFMTHKAYLLNLPSNREGQATNE